jgi:3-methyladenine DNA glycosylase AlkD
VFHFSKLLGKKRLARPIWFVNRWTQKQKGEFHFKSILAEKKNLKESSHSFLKKAVTWFLSQALTYASVPCS